MPYAEIIFISAKSGQRLNKIFETIDVVIENNSMRVATGVLNEIVTEAVAMQQPPSDKGKTTAYLLHDAGFGKTANLCDLCE